MKTVRVTILAKVTDEMFNTHIKDLREEIQSGRLQKELKEDGVKKVTVKIETLKT